VKIVVHGNPVDGLGFIGPFADDFDIPERSTEQLDSWWIVGLVEPDRSISPLDLTDDEAWNLARENIENHDVSLSRDEHGTAWALDDDTSTTYDLTNGVIPRTE
jgi:hypothetical protein